MRRYTTSTPSLIVEGVNISSYRVWVTFKQIYPDDIDSTIVDELSQDTNKTVSVTLNPTTKTVSGNDTIISCALSQEQTGQFRPGRVRAQVNWMTSGGVRKATDIVFIPSFDNLLDEVKTYG